LLNATPRFRDAKVEHARHTVGADQNVVWGYVPMDDQQRLPLWRHRLMRCMEPTQHVSYDR
jgi:hypothetical protein